MTWVDAIVGASGDRLTVHPVTEGDFTNLSGTSIEWRGVEYSELPGNPGEWMALIRTTNAELPIGVALDMISIPEFAQWLKSGFTNVEFTGDDMARVTFEDCDEPIMPGWPYVPPAIFQSKEGAFVIYLTEYFPAEPSRAANAG